MQTTYTAIGSSLFAVNPIAGAVGTVVGFGADLTIDQLRKKQEREAMAKQQIANNKLMYQEADPYARQQGYNQYMPVFKDGGPVKPDYDMARAKQLGYIPDASGHMPSRDYRTGMALKMPWHPTFHAGIEADRRMGYLPMIGTDGRVYTQSPNDLPMEGPFAPKYKKGGPIGHVIPAENVGRFMRDASVAGVSPRVLPGPSTPTIDNIGLNAGGQHIMASPGEAVATGPQFDQVAMMNGYAPDAYAGAVAYPDSPYLAQPGGTVFAANGWGWRQSPYGLTPGFVPYRPLDTSGSELLGNGPKLYQGAFGPGRSLVPAAYSDPTSGGMNFNPHAPLDTSGSELLRTATPVPQLKTGGDGSDLPDGASLGSGFGEMQKANKAAFFGNLGATLGTSLYNTFSKRTPGVAPIPYNPQMINLRTEEAKGDLAQQRQRATTTFALNSRGRAGLERSLAGAAIDQDARIAAASRVQDLQNREEEANTQISNDARMRNKASMDAFNAQEAQAENAFRLQKGQAITNDLSSLSAAYQNYQQNRINMGASKLKMEGINRYLANANGTYFDADDQWAFDGDKTAALARKKKEGKLSLYQQGQLDLMLGLMSSQPGQ